MDNTKVIVKETKNIGKGLFAKEDIKKGEIIADWTGGKTYESKKATELPEQVRDYAIQFEEHKWIDTDGIGHFFNHSCEPNCRIKGKFQIVAMRDIKKGEWLTYDYEMTEDSDWKMDCKCDSKNCRKIIGAFKNMPINIREKYKGYISDWLVKKYNL
jgi:SET domain-containing protein